MLQLQLLGLVCFVKIQVLIKATCDSFLQIEPGLLEQPKDEAGNQVTIHLGSGAFGCCNKMFYRGIPVAVKTFYSATADEVKKEARDMFNLKQSKDDIIFNTTGRTKQKDRQQKQFQNYTIHQLLLMDTNQL